MKKLILLLLLCAQTAQPSLALTRYFCCGEKLNFHIDVDKAYAEGTSEDQTAEEPEATEAVGEETIIELAPLSSEDLFEITEGLEEDLASLDQVEPLFIITEASTASGDALGDISGDNIDMMSLLFSDEPFIMVKQVNAVIEIMMRGFSFTPTNSSTAIGQFLSLQWDKITGILDIKIINDETDETPVIEENEIRIGKKFKIRVK